VLVEPRRDEGPGLIEDPRHRDQHAVRKAILVSVKNAPAWSMKIGRARRQHLVERLRQELHDVAGEIEAHAEHQQHDDERLDHPVAQLDEVRDEAFFLAHVGGVPLAGACRGGNGIRPVAWGA
jgi:hypothetical protein